MSTCLACHRSLWLLLWIPLIWTLAGCHSVSRRIPAGALPGGVLGAEPMPRELSKATLPPYVIEPPDILVIEGIHIVPGPTYPLRTGDVLSIRAQELVPDASDTSHRLQPRDQIMVKVDGTLPGAPINGTCSIGTSGWVDLDAFRFVVGPGDAWDKDLRRDVRENAAAQKSEVQPRYGSVRVVDLTTTEAEQAIEKHLRETLKEPKVAVLLLPVPGPILSGSFLIEPEGAINLDAPLNANLEPTAPQDNSAAGASSGASSVSAGTHYGSLRIAGLTRKQAQAAIEGQITTPLRKYRVTLAVVQSAGLQQIAGQHLVTPDGTVTLGSFGSVLVVGKTLAEAKRAIEGHLTRYLENPEVAVDVFAYNSKVYYVIFQGGGTGDTVYKFPITGNETVLDAFTGIGGFEYVSSTRVWIARPTPNTGSVQILPVDWEAITAQGAVATNYQLLPGDRLFIAENKMMALDTAIARITAPFERLMGFSTLGANTASRFSGRVLEGGGMRGFFGGIQ